MEEETRVKCIKDAREIAHELAKKGVNKLLRSEIPMAGFGEACQQLHERGYKALTPGMWYVTELMEEVYSDTIKSHVKEVK